MGAHVEGSGDAADVDPRIVRSRAAIVDAAIRCFLEHGYLGTSLDEIAERAQVAKRTIYNVVGGKEALFRAITHEAIDHAERYSLEVAAALGDANDVEQALRAAASQLAQVVLGGRVVPLRRLLIGEAARFPELARDYYRRAPGKVMSSLAVGLAELAERGLLAVADAQTAAEQFAFLVLGASLDRALFEADGGPPSASLVDDRALAGVEVFLRAYRPANR